MDYPEKVNQVFEKARGGELAINAVDLLTAAAEVPPPIDGDRWGNWELDAKTLVLFYSPEPEAHYYEIDLESITSSAAMLDWIFQVSGKTLASRKDIGDLVQALDNLLDPQANLCSGGLGGSTGKQFNATAHLKNYLRVP